MDHAIAFFAVMRWQLFDWCCIDEDKCSNFQWQDQVTKRQFGYGSANYLDSWPKIKIQKNRRFRALVKSESSANFQNPDYLETKLDVRLLTVLNIYNKKERGKKNSSRLFFYYFQIHLNLKLLTPNLCLGTVAGCLPSIF